MLVCNLKVGNGLCESSRFPSTFHRSYSRHKAFLSCFCCVLTLFVCCFKFILIAVLSNFQVVVVVVGGLRENAFAKNASTIAATRSLFCVPVLKFQTRGKNET